VPKGLPWKRGEKHLAVEVEDHPIDYADFEGIIPAGQYGGGTVMVWDLGNYYVHGEQPLKALADGRLHLVLEGEKAKGDWALIRIRGQGEKNQWLLLKSDSDVRPISKKRDDESAKTGRTMKQIAAQRDAEWQSNRPNDNAPTLRDKVREAVKKHIGPGKARLEKPTPRSSAVELPEKLPAARPRFIEPMKPRLLDAPPPKGDWIYELKFDGIRALAIKDGSKLKLISRNENDLTKRFEEIVGPLLDLPCDQCVIDGEVVALDEQGRSSFQLLQAREMEARKAPLSYYIFDLLQLDGKSLMNLPLTNRKEFLQALVARVAEPIRYSGAIGGDAKALLSEVKRRGLEGIIGKQANSVYEAGRRSGAWIKLKSVNEQEFVIGGYTPPGGSRKYFGALLVGYYEQERLLFAGKVGSGFDSKMLALLHKRFVTEARSDCPFADLPSKQGGQWVQGITPAMMRRCHWVNPVFVCQIRFSEWTRDAKLRQPVFIGMREDKVAAQVKRETPA
jgi:bifunctional non-homologous end joining protein LigD